MAKKRKVRKKVTPRVDSDDEERQVKWNMYEEGFYMDEVDRHQEEKEVLLLKEAGGKTGLELDSASEESDKEVLGLDLSETDEEDENDYSSNNEQEHKNLGPSDKAWGERKKTFYNTDYIDDEGEGTSDESVADEEQREALSLQRRMLENLHDTDFGLEAISEPVEQVIEPIQGPAVNVPKEVLALSKEEQLAFIEEEWPEFLELLNDLMVKEKIIKDVFEPLNKHISKCPQKFSPPAMAILSMLSRLYRLYCLNIVFYLTLRANQVSAIENHPVIAKIIALREILGHVESVVTESTLEMLAIPLSQETTLTPEVIVRSSLSKRPIKRGFEAVTREDPLEFYEKIQQEQKEKKRKKVVSFSKDLPSSSIKAEVSVVEKRPITYQIASNKGLTPHRKKEQHNPRVKHRRKFEKAMTKHRRIVKPVEAKLFHYKGQKGGIRSRLARSVKIK